MSTQEEWFPWHDGDDLTPLPILAPPCQGCKHWKPVCTYDRQAKDSARRFSATLCHSPFMRGDFGCFEPTPEA